MRLIAGNPFSVGVDSQLGDLSISIVVFTSCAVVICDAKQYLYSPNFAKTRTLTSLSMPLRSKKPC